MLESQSPTFLTECPKIDLVDLRVRLCVFIVCKVIYRCASGSIDVILKKCWRNAGAPVMQHCRNGTVWLLFDRWIATTTRCASFAPNTTTTTQRVHTARTKTSNGFALHHQTHPPPGNLSESVPCKHQFYHQLYIDALLCKRTHSISKKVAQEYPNEFGLCCSGVTKWIWKVV